MKDWKSYLVMVLGRLVQIAVVVIVIMLFVSLLSCEKDTDVELSEEEFITAELTSGQLQKRFDYPSGDTGLENFLDDTYHRNNVFTDTWEPKGRKAAQALQIVRKDQYTNPMFDQEFEMYDSGRGFYFMYILDDGSDRLLTTDEGVYDIQNYQAGKVYILEDGAIKLYD